MLLPLLSNFDNLVLSEESYTAIKHIRLPELFSQIFYIQSECT